MSEHTLWVQTEKFFLNPVILNACGGPAEPVGRVVRTASGFLLQFKESGFARLIALGVVELAPAWHQTADDTVELLELSVVPSRQARSHG